MKLLIWDIPTRLFHWLLATSVILALVLAEFAEKETPLFYLHVVFGVLAGLLIVWRIVWGLIGSHHAKWGQLFFTPTSVVNYFREVASGRGAYYAGHNPGSSLVIIGMLGFIALTVVTGIFNAQNELFEELHESLPFVVLALVGVHVTGVLLATNMHKENYALAMFTGYKKAEKSEAIVHGHPFAAIIMLVLVLGTWYYFIKGFDRNTALFSAPGTNFKFQIGEPEAGGEAEDGESNGSLNSSGGTSSEHESEDDDD